MNGSEFLKALDNIVEEKKIKREEVIEAMKQGLAAAYKKYDAKTNVRVDINEDTGDIKVISYLVVVEDYLEPTYEVDEEGNEVEIPPAINPDAQILLEDARKEVPDIKVGETIEKEVTPKDFGRVAAGVCKQVVTQKIREAEKNSIIADYADKKDEMLVGTLAMEDAKNYYVDLGRTRGILPRSEMIPGEKVTMGNSIKVYVTKVEATTKGPLILLSRNHYGFVKRLFESEIPEVNDGTILIHGVAREAGIRSKVAVSSTENNIDPIGSCIGAKGSRIANILKELNGIVSITDPEKKEALAIVDDDNLSLAIGKKGSNIRLASRLTKYKIEVKTMQQVTEEGNSNA